MTEHTAEQIRSAQEAGNSAYNLAYRAGLTPEQCGDAYRHALNVEYQRQRNEQAAPVEGRSVNPAVTLEQIEDMQARCDEQATDEPQHEGMWK